MAAAVADVKLTVADEGIGIAPADQDRIFEEFFRTEQARTASRLGTGLGLAIVRRYVDQMGGEIALHSEVGKGTTFTVMWPRYGRRAERKS